MTLLFPANLGAGAITLLAIPLSLLAAVVGVRLAGLSINSMTLGGMAIAVGALVDDAIVDVETSSSACGRTRRCRKHRVGRRWRWSIGPVERSGHRSSTRRSS